MRRKQSWLQALGSISVSPGAESSPAGKAMIGILMFSNLAFNITDLATTFVALGSGLGEGNALLLALSTGLGISVFAALVVMKAIFVASALALALVGARSANGTVRKLALSYLLTSTMVFYVVSLNNIVWISR